MPDSQKKKKKSKALNIFGFLLSSTCASTRSKLGGSGITTNDEQNVMFACPDLYCSNERLNKHLGVLLWATQYPQNRSMQCVFAHPDMHGIFPWRCPQKSRTRLRAVCRFVETPWKCLISKDNKGTEKVADSSKDSLSRSHVNKSMPNAHCSNTGHLQW